MNTSLKAELHCHLLGVISRPLLLRVAQQGRQVLVQPQEVPEIMGMGVNGFKRWLQILSPYQTASWRIYLPIIQLHIDELIRQNVVYTEITISLLMFPRSKKQLLQEFGCFHQHIIEMERGRIQLEFLIILPRKIEPDVLDADVDRLLALHSADYIAGISVAGLDVERDLRLFSSALRRLKDAGLGISIHAGEHSGPEEVWIALDECGADRVGHGIAAFQDARLLERIKNDRIHLEFCLTSNVKTGAVKSIGEHPVRLAHDLNLNYSINTDDPGAFNCSLETEYDLLCRAISFGLDDFANIYRNTLASRFQPKLRYI